jgi:NADH dehydrogenase
VLLLEGQSRLLPSFDPVSSESARKQLVKLGVEVRTSAFVTRIEDHRVEVGDEVIFTPNVFWAAGVQASSIGARLGAPTDRSGRVHVEPDCSIPGHPEVFVIGDLANFIQDGKPVPGVAQGAMQMGSHVARCIRRDLAGKPRVPFRYFDKGSIATIGRAAAVAEIRKLRLSGFIAWLVWVFIHILYLIGFRNRLVVMIQWAWSWLLYQRGTRLITGLQNMQLRQARAPAALEEESENVYRVG